MNEQEQMQFFYEIFDNSLPRQGPGSTESTLKALDLLARVDPRLEKDYKEEIKVLDIGCGTGAQTIQLAKRLNGKITALDNHKSILDELGRNAETEGVNDKIQILQKDMNKLSPDDGLYDLVWSEGAFFIMGFREGCTKCDVLLEPGGLMAVSDIAWFRPDPPEECKKFLAEECSFMVDTETNLATVKECGYRLINNLRLPESDWIVNYYDPLVKRLQLLRDKYFDNPERIVMINSVYKEIEIYRKYSDYYGYDFYLVKRP